MSERRITRNWSKRRWIVAACGAVGAFMAVAALEWFDLMPFEVRWRNDSKVLPQFRGIQARVEKGQYLERVVITTIGESGAKRFSKNDLEVYVESINPEGAIDLRWRHATTKEYCDGALLLPGGIRRMNKVWLKEGDTRAATSIGGNEVYYAYHIRLVAITNQNDIVVVVEMVE